MVEGADKMEREGKYVLLVQSGSEANKEEDRRAKVAVKRSTRRERMKSGEGG